MWVIYINYLELYFFKVWMIVLYTYFYRQNKYLYKNEKRFSKIF